MFGLLVLLLMLGFSRFIIVTIDIVDIGYGVRVTSFNIDSATLLLTSFFIFTSISRHCVVVVRSWNLFIRSLTVSSDPRPTLLVRN